MTATSAMSAVLWDLDDTLLDTLAARMHALDHAYELCLGSKTDPLALWRSHRGGTLEDLGRRLLGADYLKFTTAYRDYYYGQQRTARPFAGIPEVLAHFAEHQVPMAVVTSKSSWGATDELASTGLLQFFGAVVGFDDTDEHKPDPEPVLAALDRLAVDATENVLFVGDSPADIFAARNAGCQPVAALWGTLDQELLEDASPAHFVHKPDEVWMLFAESKTPEVNNR